MTLVSKTITIDQAAAIMKLLGDKTRLTMMKMLQRNECCVCEFTAIFQASQPAISQHLRKLKDAGLVKEKRNGQWVFYSLNRDSEIYEFVQNLLEFVPDQDQRLKDLEKQGLRIICE
ncbi:metalloregulator ArsR/SmtB family transcription factor [Bacillus mangrovi]|uniref:Metalloregulator ArsR/SmtB family transcription factor n=1 Tax=Metabacillus mangrovi TaxID=1491830 RepID=A0A7X2S1D9_9BACI|nr:metalloregulator ArsR/SmtB family transcription factor [Metabacillus mangrovi]MTH51890.1 metalloregulator ArsR/SmtB family transcription factor [Metabacillus mangrovi]